VPFFFLFSVPEACEICYCGSHFIFSHTSIRFIFGKCFSRFFFTKRIHPSPPRGCPQDVPCIASVKLIPPPGCPSPFGLVVFGCQVPNLSLSRRRHFCFFFCFEGFVPWTFCYNLFSLHPDPLPFFVEHPPLNSSRSLSHLFSGPLICSQENQFLSFPFSVAYFFGWKIIGIMLLLFPSFFCRFSLFYFPPLLS